MIDQGQGRTDTGDSKGPFERDKPVPESTPPDRSRRRSAEQRRAEILEAAAILFFQQGYTATSIDMLIERIGGSKRDVYRDFGSKEGLFQALISETIDTVMTALDEEDVEGKCLRETLIGFGRRLMAVYMSPTFFGVYHSILSEAPRFPELARSFYERGPGRSEKRLADIFHKAAERGEIRLEDPARAADLFFGMFRGNLHFQVVLGLREVPDKAEIDRYVETAVDIFLSGLEAGESYIRRAIAFGSGYP